MSTWKQKFNKKYNFSLDEDHGLDEIARLTGYKKEGLETIYRKGQGAFYTNPQSVRPQVKSDEQWAMARVYSAVMGGKAARVDASHLEKKSSASSEMPFHLELGSGGQKFPQGKAMVVNTATGKHYSAAPIPIADAKRQMRILEDYRGEKEAKRGYEEKRKELRKEVESRD